MMLQPSQHPVMRNYEEGQNDVGAWFAAAGIGLTRGERRKDKVRQALKHNAKLREDQQTGSRLKEVEIDLPHYRQHVSPRKWREEQEKKLATREKHVAAAESSVAERETIAEIKDREADEVLNIAATVADGDFRGLEPANALDGKDLPQSSRPNIARQLFQCAIERLRTEQRAKARAEVVAGAFDQIRRADDAIVRIANLLPEALRQQIASASSSLTQAIAALGRRSERPGQMENEEPPRD